MIVSNFNTKKKHWELNINNELNGAQFPI